MSGVRDGNETRSQELRDHPLSRWCMVHPADCKGNLFCNSWEGGFCASNINVNILFDHEPSEIKQWEGGMFVEPIQV